MGFKALAIGTGFVTAAMGVYAAYVIGSLSVANRVNFTTASSGAILDVAGQTRFRTAKGTCTATGGLTTYTKCYVSAPFSTTGALLGFALEAGNHVKAQPGDVTFKKGLFSASGAALTNGNNLSVGTGSYLASWLAVPVAWNPADILGLTTLTTPDGTLNSTRYNLEFWAFFYDKSGT